MGIIDNAMTMLHAILLGVVQGLTEFLPISSSGHLLIGQGSIGFAGAIDTLRHCASLSNAISSHLGIQKTHRTACPWQLALADTAS